MAKNRTVELRGKEVIPTAELTKEEILALVKATKHKLQTCLFNLADIEDYLTRHK